MATCGGDSAAAIHILEHHQNPRYSPWRLARVQFPICPVAGWIMARPETIPTPAVRRLSLYLRQLETFGDSNLRTISSKQLGQALRITDAQVRKDLAYFGQFGRAGIGYNVPELIARLRGILGTDRIWKVLVVGTGNLGRALAAYRGFHKKGFELVAAFDTDESKIRRPVSPGTTLAVRPMAELAAVVRDMDVRLGILTVPAAAAPAVAQAMIAAGIQGILNFAPIALHLPEPVAVTSVDLTVHLEQLLFEVTALQSKG